MRRAGLNHFDGRLAFAVASLLCLTGCVYKASYVPICGPSDISPELVEQLVGTAKDTAGDNPRLRTLGLRHCWIPFITLHYANNDLYQGSAWVSAPPGIIVKRPHEKWIYAKSFSSIGPLALPWGQIEEAFFDMDGKNFAYYRTGKILWGFLWQDSESRRLDVSPKESRSVGLFFTAFGYGSVRTPEGSVKSLRFLWIPIPVSRQP